MTDRNYDFCKNTRSELITSEQRVSELLDEVDELESKIPRWISVEERLPEIAPLGVTATVIVAHAEYAANREPTGNVKVSPASFLGSDQQGPFFKSMINGRRLYTNAWMPLPEPPEVT